MIASTAALFAILASLSAGQVFNVLPNAGSRAHAIAACQANGQQLASLTGATIDHVSALLPAGKAGWIASWNGDSYGGACLQLSQGTVTVAASCDAQLLPICQGTPAPAPCPPHPEPCSESSSSSSSCSEPSVPSCESSSSSSVSCESSVSAPSCESSESSWSCESSSSSSCESSTSYSCSSSFDSSICESSSSSSSSSSGHCDPCCAGVRKLTYQAPFGPGIYLAKVTQRFTVFDVFGPNACQNVQTLAATLGVNAVLVGSNGTNACYDPVDSTTVDPTPYGTYYVVSRAWALNQPIYALWNGTVYAANSLYNCYGEYRAILLNKSLSELTFVTNNNGNVCFERCHGKPDCLALCNGLPRPSYLPKFEIPK